MTLVEALLALALLIGIITAASGLYVSAMQSQKETEMQARVQDTVRNVVSQIDQDVKAARSVLESAVVAGSPYYSSASTLILKIPALDSSGFVPDGYDTVIYTYEPSLRAVRVVVSPHAQSRRPAENRLISKFLVETLSFQYFTLDMVEKHPGASPPDWDEVVLVRSSVAASITDSQKTCRFSLEDEARLRNWEPPAS
ncbi:MAG: hypothetical protein ACUVTZ_03970 [Armatimonadota bacterium]